MVGREVFLQVKKDEAKPEEEILNVEDLWVHDARGLLAVKGVSLNIKKGEILEECHFMSLPLPEKLSGLMDVSFYKKNHDPLRYINFYSSHLLIYIIFFQFLKL